MVTVLKIFVILIVLAFGFIWLIGKGLKQKFGRFDMPQNELDIYITKLLEDETIADVYLPDLRHRLIQLGFTDLSEKEIIIELKKILNKQ